MTAAYDAFSKDYQRTKASPVRAAVESYTLDRLLGDPRGLAILDAGCGEGFHARRLVKKGAARVAGVDVSSAMIELAREQERAEPLGIQYACCAVEDLPDLLCSAGFDVAFASYLLHYAPDEEVLRRMCRRLGNSLVIGGRLVALTENPDQSPADYAGYAPYGFDKQALDPSTEPRAEGSRIRYGLAAGRRIFNLDTFWYSRAAYASALEAAGFGSVEWHPLAIDPAAPSPEYYRAYVDNPPVLGLTAVKLRP